MKKFKIIFSVLCIALCALPFVSMTFAKTDSTTENRRLAQFPSLVEDSKLNTSYLQQLGNYFDDHYAFRSTMINADSLVQGNAFGVSNAQTVVKGKNGWLYYSDTLDDYMSKAKFNIQGIKNAARNISIIQSYATANDIKFVFTIAPNKNSLYGDNMPYYYNGSYNETKCVLALEPLLKEKGINYADLFEMFEATDEVLYLKRDSHWNNKGAMLAYNKIMDNLGVAHNDYATVKAVRKKTEIGDLNRMLYPLTAQGEWNYYYQLDDNFSYVTETESVEEAWIETKSDSTNGCLLMFRDSFGNTLLPFFAREFGSAYFSKGTPYALESYIEQCKPDCIVIEKVERNIDELAFDPPVATVKSDRVISQSAALCDKATVSLSDYEGDAAYAVIDGTVDDSLLTDTSDIFVQINGTLYTAFSVSSESGDNGYRVYIKKDALESENEISVFVCDKDGDTLAKTERVVL